MANETQTPYRVLARKYRPSTFDDLIGQAPMVQTLSNAFKMGRIAQAYMLTGVRGVGKTTTARILARALNYEKPAEGGAEAVDAPTIDMPDLGVHCDAIIQSRHVDVIEMDAASHTSINDIREIIEASRYKPATARYKVYIIDEVHMLSTAAFNGLLKTLEEPPPHVKFIFATTEIRKVPITVLSRCQRFDLRRIDAETMSDYLKGICAKEGVEIHEDALRLLARASEGSARDALSLLDQAIAHSAASGGAELIGEEDLRTMLGLADRARIIDLFEMVMSGKIAEALAELNALYNAGANPHVVLSDLAEFTHLLTRLKVAPDVPDQGAMSPRERERGTELAASLPVRVLSTSWQILLKGLSEVAQADKPLAAADMVLLRLAYAADLPSPDEALRQWQSGGANTAAAPAAAPASSAGGPTSQTSASTQAAAAPTVSTEPPQLRSVGGQAAMQSRAAPSPLEAPQPIAETEQAPAYPTVNSFDDLLQLAQEKRSAKLIFALERQIRPVRFSDGHLEIALTDDAPTSISGELGAQLSEWTGKRWMVSLVRDEAPPTLYEQEQSARAAEIEAIRQDPLVAKALESFPGAELKDIVRRNGSPKPNSETED